MEDTLSVSMRITLSGNIDSKNSSTFSVPYPYSLNIFEPHTVHVKLSYSVLQYLHSALFLDLNDTSPTEQLTHSAKAPHCWQYRYVEYPFLLRSIIACSLRFTIFESSSYTGSAIIEPIR